MTRRRTHRRLPLLLIVMIWLAGGMPCASAQSPKAADAQGLWIISSSDNPFFRRSIARIQDALSDRFGQARSLLIDDLDQNPLQLAHAALIITLGARAMQTVRSLNLDQPQLHAYLTRYQYLNDPPSPGSHSLLLDQPLERYIRFDRLLTGARRIGILSPAATAFKPDLLARTARDESVDLVQKTLPAKSANPVAAVRHLLQKTDNLLALPAPDIYNRNTLKGILLAAYRLRKPVISYSPAHVRAGALGALYATPEQIGDQIAELARAWLLGTPPGQPFSLARYYRIEINRRVASALGITVPDRQQLRQAIDNGATP